jgi:hypothetical protein
MEASRIEKLVRTIFDTSEKVNRQAVLSSFARTSKSFIRKRQRKLARIPSPDLIKSLP